MERKFSNFLVICCGQFVSILGSGISSFGLSVWIFYNTGQATPFALSFLCSILPAILFAPFAGSFADRKNRKKVIMLTDTFDAFLKILMAALLFTGVMRVWMVYPILFLSSTFSAFQSPAFSASIPMLVTEKNLSRANGLLQLSSAAQNLIAPVLAGILYPIIHLQGMLVLDFLTYFVGMVTIAVNTIPQEITATKNKRQDIHTVFEDFKEAWNIIKNEHSFLQIVIVFSILNFIANVSMILIGPLVLSEYSSSIYGTVQTVYAIAMLIGSLLSGILPNTKKIIIRMFGVLTVSGIGLMITGISPNWIVIATGMFIFYFFVPYANTLFQTYFQSTFDSNVLGRIGALVSALLKVASPLACIFSGPIVDYILNPLMMEDGVLGKSFIGNLIGYGEGRGTGLMFLLCGMILTMLCLWMCFKGRLAKKVHKALN